MAGEVWDRDYELFDLAGIDTVTLGVFDWAQLQPSADRTTSTCSTRIVHGGPKAAQICLATGTGAFPPWLAAPHPEVTRIDFEGAGTATASATTPARLHPSSSALRRSSPVGWPPLRQQEAVVAWHIGNEYGGACYCDLCTVAFRRWLRQRYSTLDGIYNNTN